MNTLHTLKVGDEVAVMLNDRLDRIETITKATPAQVSFPGASPGTLRTFWRKNGREVGVSRDTRAFTSYDYTVRPATGIDEIQLAYRKERRELVDFIRNADTSGVDIAVLREAVKTLRDGRAVRR